MGKHAILSPSSAYRWIACTPSARFEEQLPEEESAYAAEGTLAHSLAALLLKKVQTARFDLRQIEALKSHELYSAEMPEHCEAYRDFILSIANGAFIHVEREYDMSAYIPLQHGTCDASFIKGETLYVVDFKYGAGVKVRAAGNRQMLCYALGAYDCHSKGHAIKNVILVIYQPRAGGVSSWELSIQDLLKWAETEAAPKGRLAIAGAGEFVPGEHCRFCKARTLCKAYYDCFADLKAIRDKRVMTDADVADVLTYGPLIASWVKKVEEDVTAKMEKGEKVPGFKLVAGRGRRSFRNEDDVVDILIGEGYESYQIFDPKLNSLTAIEKLVGPKRFKALFENQVINVPGKAQIAPEGDERPAIGASAADEFDDLI
jgi:RecB family exonuclease